MTDEETISLFSADGKEMKFKKIASVPMDGSEYVVLAPADAVPGMNDNQALVFELTSHDGDKAALNIVTDMAVVSQVFDTYTQMMLYDTEQKARRKDLF